MTMTERGHAEWDAMPHKKRVNAVATIFACKDKPNIDLLCRELYMVKWITEHQDELLKECTKISKRLSK
jgi:hypothetical protein